MFHTSTAATAAAIAACALVLAGCGRNEGDNRSAGQKLDSVIAKAEQKTEEVRAEAREAGKEIRQVATQAADATGNKARDMGITAELNAQLARDDQLSALRIDVDTVNGQVVMRGTAPNAAARDRATTLARGIEGVTGIDNQLVVRQP